MPLGKAVLEIDVAGDLKKKLQEQQALSQKFIDAQGKLKTLGQVNLDLEKRKAEWMASPKGQKVLREQVEMSKQLAAVMKQQNWAEKVAEQGRVGASLSLLQEKFQAVGDSMKGLFTASTIATAGMYGLVAAANPSLFSTMNDSFKMVSVQLGRFLVPVVKELAAGLQNLSSWFQSLDSDTRQQIATWAGWIAKAALAVVALKGVLMAGGLVIGVLSPLVSVLFLADKAFLALKLSMLTTTGVFVGLRAAIAGTWALLAAHPITALVGAVGALAAAFFFLKNRAREANDELAGDQGVKRVEHEVRARDIREAPQDVRKRFAEAQTNPERQQILQEWKKAAELRQGQAQQEQLANTAQALRIEPAVQAAIAAARNQLGIPANQGAGMRAMADPGGFDQAVKDLGRRLELIGFRPGANVTPTEFARNILTRGGNVDVSEHAAQRNQVPLAKVNAEVEAARRAAAGAGAGDGAQDQMKQNLQMPFQSKFMAYAQYSEAQQLAALNTGDAQAELMRQQLVATLEGNKEAFTNTDNVRKQLEGIRAALANLGI